VFWAIYSDLSRRVVTPNVGEKEGIPLKMDETFSLRVYNKLPRCVVVGVGGLVKASSSFYPHLSKHFLVPSFPYAAWDWNIYLHKSHKW